jgi:hypothetical protein
MKKEVVKTKKCALCKTEFVLYRSIDKYCSLKCAMAAEKQKTHKQRNGRIYRKALQTKEPVRRVKAKARTKKRDLYKCMLAGVIPHKCSPFLDSHHILYLSEGGVDEDWNLITLCRYAHHEIAHRHKDLQWRLLSLVGGDKWYEKIDRASLPENVKKKLDYLQKITEENSRENDNIVLL